MIPKNTKSLPCKKKHKPIRFVGIRNRSPYRFSGKFLHLVPVLPQRFNERQGNYAERENTKLGHSQPYWWYMREEVGDINKLANIMKIIPSEKIEFNTTLSITEVDNEVRKNIQPKRGIRIGFSKKENDKVFEGNHSNGKFEVQRVIYHRNSFLPQIKGTYQSSVNGT